MDMYLRCLTPVHVGTGSTLEPFEYILADGHLVRVDLEAVMRRLDEAAVDALSRWVSDGADRIAGSADNREQSAVRRDLHLLAFARSRRDAELEQALRGDPGLARYRARTGLREYEQVMEQAKDPAGLPALAGSSVKGALRTALAFLALQEMEEAEADRLVGALRGKLKPSARTRKDDIGQEVEKRVFRCGVARGGGGPQGEARVRFDDIHYDLMRVIQVGDGQPLTAPPAPGAAPGAPAGAAGPELLVARVASCAPARDRRSGNVRLAPQRQMSPLEAHAPGNTFVCRLRIDAKLLLQIDAAAKRKSGEWLEFAARVRRAFGPQALEALQKGDEEALRAAIHQRLRRACAEFARTVLAREKEWCQRYEHETREVAATYEKLAAVQEPAAQPPGATLLRLGGASHIHSTTVMLAMMGRPEWDERRKVLGEVFDKFKIHLGPRGRQLQKPPAAEQVLDRFPSARRLVQGEGQRAAAPLGWLAWADDGVALPEPVVPLEALVRPAPAPRRAAGAPPAGGRPSGPRGGSGSSRPSVPSWTGPSTARRNRRMTRPQDPLTPPGLPMPGRRNS